MVSFADQFAVVDAGTAVLLVIGGQDFAPATAARQWHLVVLPRFAREVDNNDELFALGTDPHEAQRVVIGVIAGLPLEAGGIEVLAP